MGARHRALDLRVARPTPPPTLARRTHPTSPNSCYAHTRTGVRTMPLTPQHRRRAPHAAGNHARANADQTSTEVDTRLTKVDKGCQKLSTVNPRYSRAPLRRTPNKPEQIRTNLNAAKRPDQIGTPPDHPRTARKKQTLNTAAAHPPPHPRLSPPAPKIRHSCPLLVIPVLFSSFLPPLRHSCPLSVIPAQAGTHLAPILLSCSLPQFIPPPFQGGG